MHVQRIAGWRFLLLCFVVGTVGGVVANLGLRKIKSGWTQLPTKLKALVVCAVVTAYITVAISTGSDVFETVFFVIVVLALLGAYSLFSRVLDRLWTRLTSR